VKPTIGRYEIHLADRLQYLQNTLNAATALILLGLCATATNATAALMSALNDYAAWPPAAAGLASCIITAALILARRRTRREHTRVTGQLEQCRQYRREIAIHRAPRHSDTVDAILFAHAVYQKGKHL
jgi:hypothetical protein